MSDLTSLLFVIFFVAVAFFLLILPFCIVYVVKHGKKGLGFVLYFLFTAPLAVSVWFVLFTTVLVEFFG